MSANEQLVIFGDLGGILHFWAFGKHFHIPDGERNEGGRTNRNSPKSVLWSVAPSHQTGIRGQPSSLYINPTTELSNAAATARGGEGVRMRTHETCPPPTPYFDLVEIFVARK